MMIRRHHQQQRITIMFYHMMRRGKHRWGGVFAFWFRQNRAGTDAIAHLFFDQKPVITRCHDK